MWEMWEVWAKRVYGERKGGGHRLSQCGGELVG